MQPRPFPALQPLVVGGQLPVPVRVMCRDSMRLGAIRSWNNLQEATLNGAPQARIQELTIHSIFCKEVADGTEATFGDGRAPIPGQPGVPPLAPQVDSLHLYDDLIGVGDVSPNTAMATFGFDPTASCFTNMNTRAGGRVMIAQTAMSMFSRLYFVKSDGSAFAGGGWTKQAWYGDMPGMRFDAGGWVETILMTPAFVKDGEVGGGEHFPGVVPKAVNHDALDGDSSVRRLMWQMAGFKRSICDNASAMYIHVLFDGFFDVAKSAINDDLGRAAGDDMLLFEFSHLTADMLEPLVLAPNQAPAVLETLFCVKELHGPNMKRKMCHSAAHVMRALGIIAAWRCACGNAVPCRILRGLRVLRVLPAIGAAAPVAAIAAAVAAGYQPF